MIVIVAIGDSLTVGYDPTSINHPYTNVLMEKIIVFLKQLEKNHVADIRIRNKGINGDLTSDMLLRFRRDVITIKPNYVIILGGTNDIGWGLQVEEIFVNLKRMFEMAIKNLIKPIGCSVPSILGWDEGILPRLQLNQLLENYCGEKKIPLVNIFRIISNSSTKRLRSIYSSDGLHLNELGYRKIAEAIFEEAVKEIVINELN